MLKVLAAAALFGVTILLGVSIAQEEYTATSYSAVREIMRVECPTENVRSYPQGLFSWFGWGEYSTEAHQDVKRKACGLGWDDENEQPVYEGYNGFNLYGLDPFGWIDELLDDDLP